MITLYDGDCLETLKKLPSKTVQCVVTSPPYWGLRDYGKDEQLGMEKTPQLYVEHVREIFKEIRRVLRNDGVVWLNIGDTYVGTGKGEKRDPKASEHRNTKHDPVNNKVPGMRSKNLVGIPWRVAFALQDDGWYLRQDIIWEKPNAMPEPVKDRCTRSHEYIFLFSKSKMYYFDNEAISEPAIHEGAVKKIGGDKYGDNNTEQFRIYSGENYETKGTRNKRSVWTISTKHFMDSHFATFPVQIPEICIKASTKVGDVVLDPFAGAGTTGLVADRLQRNALLLELNTEYCDMIEQRIMSDAPMLVNLERIKNV